jgi:hypothetical protein
MKTPTIYEIKRDIESQDQNNHYFFSKKTMKFFGQRLRDFLVRKSPKGRIFILANIRFCGGVVGFTFKEYLDHKLVNPYNDSGHVFDDRKLENILYFIKTH